MKAKKTRDYSNLRETERVYEAVKRQGTHVKDYSQQNIVEVHWKTNSSLSSNRLVVIRIGATETLVSSLALMATVNAIVDEADENDALPRLYAPLPRHFGKPELVISTKEVNYESLRDHVAEIRIKDATALIDLEELLKATRYG